MEIPQLQTQQNNTFINLYHPLSMNSEKESQERAKNIQNKSIERVLGV